jgi:hypothetical protein
MSQQKQKKQQQQKVQLSHSANNSPNVTLGDLLGNQLQQAFAAATSGEVTPKQKPASTPAVQANVQSAVPASSAPAKPKSAPKTRFHTLVFHTNPDLESTMIAWLILSFAWVAQRLGVAKAPDVKFISAGPLRADEWPDIPAAELTVEHLMAQGYLFLDVAGGDFDHHRRYPDKMSNEQSSLDIVVGLSGADVVLGHIKSVVQAVSDNDLRGQQIVRDTTYRESSTPHTPRHLRNVIRGWNRCHADSPQSVLDLACLAYSGIAAVAGSESYDTPETVRQLFLADDLVKAVQAFCVQAVFTGELEAAVATELEEAFAASVEAALQSLEADWRGAEVDYFRPTTEVHKLKRRVRFKEAGKWKTAVKPLVLVTGVSDHERFAEVARHGNCGEQLPYPDKPRRKKADVCIHFRSDGRFVVVSRHTDLGRVAAAIRHRDLARKGVDLSLVDPKALEQIGHLEFPTKAGKTAQALLLAYPKCFGNAFRANPEGIECTLQPSEIVQTVISTLTGESR